MGFFSNEVKVPKIIHFVWVGGALATKQMYHVSGWARKNTNWQVWLWRDARHLGANVLRRAVAGNDALKTAATRSYANDNQRKAFMQSQDLWTAERVDALDGVSKQRDFVSEILGAVPNVQLKDVGVDLSGMNNADLYRQEMGDWGGNMAAASDILRVEILIAFGGVYLDVDLECMQPFGTFTVRKDLAKFGNWVSPQGEPRVNNAIIAAAKDSKLLKAYRARIQRNYGIKGGGEDVLKAAIDAEVTALLGGANKTAKQQRFNDIGGHWKSNYGNWMIPSEADHHSLEKDGKRSKR